MLPVHIPIDPSSVDGAGLAEYLVLTLVFVASEEDPDFVIEDFE